MSALDDVRQQMKLQRDTTKKEVAKSQQHRLNSLSRRLEKKQQASLPQLTELSAPTPDTQLQPPTTPLAVNIQDLTWTEKEKILKVLFMKMNESNGE